MKKKKMSSNYEFFIKADTSQYKGEWIAIARNKIISHGKDAKDVYKKAVKKAGDKDVSLAKVPNEQMLLPKFI